MTNTKNKPSQAKDSSKKAALSNKVEQRIEVVITHTDGQPDLAIEMNFEPKIMRVDTHEFNMANDGTKAVQGMAKMLADAIVKRLNE